MCKSSTNLFQRDAVTQWLSIFISGFQANIWDIEFHKEPCYFICFVSNTQIAPTTPLSKPSEVSIFLTNIFLAPTFSCRTVSKPPVSRLLLVASDTRDSSKYVGAFILLSLASIITSSWLMLFSKNSLCSWAESKLAKRCMVLRGYRGWSRLNGKTRFFKEFMSASVCSPTRSVDKSWAKCLSFCRIVLDNSINENCFQTSWIA